MYSDMKKFMNLKVIGYGLWVMVALLVGAPITAQNQQEWQTSTMVGSGSAYSPQVTAVGATTVSCNVTTTETYSPTNGPRRVIGTNPDGGEGSNDSPIGDAMVPLMLCALAFCGVVYFRRKRALNR